MRYIFAGVGGSGTTFVVDGLRKKYLVDSKPDTYFVHKDQPFTKKSKRQQHQLITSYQDLPSKTAKKSFLGRTDYRMDAKLSIEKNLVQYIKSVQDNPKKTALFNAAYKFDFFTRNSISDYVAVTRHPITAYLSFASSKRHLNLLNYFGGADKEESMRYYAFAWNKVVDQARELSNSHILRYEFLDVDTEKIGLSWICKKWKPSKRQVNISGLKYLYSLVEDNYKYVYEDL